MRFFVVLAAIGLANASGGPMQNFAFTTHGQGSHFTMMQKVIPQAVPMAHAPMGHAMQGHAMQGMPGGIQVGYGAHPVAMPQKAITVQAGPAMGYGGYGGGEMMMGGPGPMAPAPTAKALTLGSTAFGANALQKNMAFGPPVGVGGPVLAQGPGPVLAQGPGPMMAQAGPGPMMAMDKGMGAGPYAGFSVGLAAGGKDMSTATFAHGAPMAHGPTNYAPGPLGTFSAEKASLASLPSKGFVAGQPIEMITAQKTFFAGPGHAVGYANAGPSMGGAPVALGHGLGLAGPVEAMGGQAAMAAQPVAAVAAPAHGGYGPDFAFAEKIFASAPAGLYGKPYATSPLATKSMMIK